MSGRNRRPRGQAWESGALECCESPDLAPARRDAAVHGGAACVARHIVLLWRPRLHGPVRDPHRRRPESRAAVTGAASAVSLQGLCGRSCWERSPPQLWGQQRAVSKSRFGVVGGVALHRHVQGPPPGTSGAPAIPASLTGHGPRGQRTAISHFRWLMDAAPQGTQGPRGFPRTGLVPTIIKCRSSKPTLLLLWGILTLQGLGSASGRPHWGLGSAVLIPCPGLRFEWLMQ